MDRHEVPEFDLDKTIAKAKERLIAEGKEVNSLSIYRMVPVIRKEQIREYYKRTKDRSNRND